MIDIKKIVATILAATFCTAILVGCEGKKTSVSDSGKSSDSDKNSSVLELPPGKDEVVAISESKGMSDIEITYNNVFELQNKPKNSQIILVEVTVKNNGEEDFSVEYYNHFKGYIDGEYIEYKEYMPATVFIACSTYAHEKGEEKDLMTGIIPAGETVKGYYPLQLSDPWETLEIRFFPEYATSNDAVMIKITPDMVTDAP